MEKNSIRIVLGVFFIAVLLTSCLEYGLEDLPAYDLNFIDKVKFEHRIFDEEANALKITNLTNQTTTDSITSTIYCSIMASGSAVEKYDIKRSNIVCICDISIAARIDPVDPSPILGMPGDYTKDQYQYKVTAANGDERIWTLEIEANFD